MKTVGIIGAGKVGVSLGIGLFLEGPVSVGGYFSRTLSSATYGALRTDSVVYEDLQSLVEDNEVILIATPDDVIGQIWQALLQFNISGKIICHTAGSLSSSIFFKRTTKDVFVASIHPMLAIESRERGHLSLESAFFTLEGDDVAVTLLSSVLDAHNISYKTLKIDDKAGYHLATSLVSNSFIALGKVAVDLLTDAGFTEAEALSALKPLAEGNMTNFFALGATDALTGPVERGDASTIGRHLQALESHPKARALYVAASDVLLDISEKKHPKRDDTPVRQLLKGVDHEKN